MYDFRQLSPADFEDLTRDLLQRHWNVHLEAFKTGRDDGIDLRFSRIPGAETIIQCKHFAGSRLSKLVSELRRTELPKIARLAPPRYVLVTSLPLSPANKQRILNVVPYIRVPEDIFGADDVNNLLGKHSEVETQHFKLWLSSTAVLERVLHNADKVQTEFDVDRVQRAIPLYVQTSNYRRAMEIVSEHKFVIISGVPGIGKTTLADMLLFAHLEAGYQPFVLKSDIAEGRRHFKNEARQVFYFDDFLGETFLGNRHDFLGKKEDSAILDFMQLITRSKNGRLILTTREHILRHAFQISERFRRRQHGLVENRFVLQLDDYTVLDRGRILYNHIYFSDLPAPYKRALIKDAFYMEVLRHRNYNPRLIEWLSRFANVRATPVGSYPREIRRVLEHPEELWRLAFEQQISEASRSALLGLYSLGGKARIEELEIIWRALHRNRAEKYRFSMAAEDWRRALQEMEGGFLAFDSGNVSFVNPSVRDFLDATIVSTPDHLEDILASSVRFRQVVSIWKLAESEKAEGVSQSLRRYMESLIASASRNLQKPYEIKINFGKGSYGIREVDTRPEERLRTMLSIAVATGSEGAVADCRRLLDRGYQVMEQPIPGLPFGGNTAGPRCGRFRPIFRNARCARQIEDGIAARTWP